MDITKNRMVKGMVRRDLPSRPQIVYVPWDMPDEDIREQFGKLAQQGLVRRLTPTTRQVAPEGEVPGEEPGPPQKIIIQPPAVVQLTPDLGAGDLRNRVSRALGGPTWIRHVNVFFEDVTVAVVEYPSFGLHVTVSPDVGPFAGDMVIFTHRGDRQGFYDVELEGHHVQGGSMSTAVGARPQNNWEYFPNIFVPYRTFYLNASALYSANVVEALISTSFGAAEIMEGEEFGFKRIQTRPTIPPPVRTGRVQYVQVERAVAAPTPSVETAAAPRVAAPRKVAAQPPAKAQFEKLFKNYADIKKYQSLGNTIVWATLRNTGQGASGFPLAVTVVGIP